MHYHDLNILIACGNKKDRLAFFNFFDEQNASQIFTASNMDQVMDMLDAEDDIGVLVTEISPHWLKSKSQVEQIKKIHKSIKVIGVFSESVNVDSQAYQTMTAWIDDSYFSPIAANELKARMTLDIKTMSPSELAHVKSAELDTVLNHVFPNTRRPQFLYDVSSGTVAHANDAMNQWQANDDLIGHSYVVLAENPTALDTAATEQKLNEEGVASMAFELKQQKGQNQKHITLTMHAVHLDGNPYYLGELEDTSLPVFYQQFINKLRSLQQIDFNGTQFEKDMKALMEWTGVEFLFAVNNGGRDSYDELIWDFSSDQKSELFIKAEHAFIQRQLAKKNRLEIEKGASKLIPGDEFITFYAVDQLLLYRCYVEKGADLLLVAGGQRTPFAWQPLTLLFSELADHLAKFMAFKALRALHESESRYDVLTGLANRRFIVKTMEQDLLDGKQQDQFKALAFLDLDRFKIINDSLGHDVGDSVLISVAQVLNKHVGQYGMAARYAGDEFLIWFNRGESPTVVQHVANQILKAVASPIALNNGSELKITVSMGITYYPEHAKTTGQLIKNADTALYDAKLQGKNRYSEYNDSQVGDSPKQLEQMEKNLSHAIENNELDVFFQPKIDAQTEDIMGFEALVRWEHPELGLISPGLFIPLAEQTGLIHKIGYLVLYKSCQILRQWQSEFGLQLNMSINLSPLQLSDKKLISRIKQVIEKTKVHPQFIDFEITESEKFENVTEALKMMRQIVDLGCTLSIDDFGTGHSTLEYIRKIPAKTLKIDQTFVKNIGLSPDDEAILDATIDIAKRVGHKIVAEGVETEAQRHYLAAKGCEYFQGFLFCRPLPANEISRILGERAALLSQAI